MIHCKPFLPHAPLAPRKRTIAAVLAVLVLAVGCNDRGNRLAPLRGRVYYKDKPLEFGSVSFLSAGGLEAYGAIRSDGTFELETPKLGKGGTPGLNKVRVACFEAQQPGFKGSGLSLGKSLIPERYTKYVSSGLKITVKPDGNELLELRLTE